MTDADLRRAYWWIEWDKPIKATFADGSLRSRGYICRYCVAHRGLTGHELRDRQGTYEEIAAHIAEMHPTPA